MTESSLSESTAPRVVQGRLPDAELAAVRGIVERAEQHDGVAPLSEQFRLALDLDDAVHLRTPHGYAGIIVPPAGGAASIEAVVDPAFRGRGEGAGLVAAALARGRRLGDGAPRVWAHGDLPVATVVADRLQLAKVRELLQLRRPLAPADPGAVPLPEVPERTDLIVRTYAGPSDDAELLRVNNAAFAWHPEQGGWAQRQISDRTSAGWFDPAGLFLAFDAADADRLLGFHWTKVHDAQETGGQALGEVYVVAVDPGAQGRGLGSLLTLTGLRHLAQAGLSEVELYVEGDNAAALATYRGLGFAPYAIDAAYA